MNAKERRRKSEFLSLVLHHQPDTIGIELDEAGWVDVELLMTALTRQKKGMSRATLDEVMRTNDKQRFSFSEDGTRNRANTDILSMSNWATNGQHHQTLSFMEPRDSSSTRSP